MLKEGILDRALDKQNNKEKEDIFTVRELADYLKMKPVTIYKHALRNKLPAFKVGSHWRFKKKTIDEWIAQQEHNGV